MKNNNTNNVLIATFMENFKMKALQYNTSWNKLIPVIKQIENLGYFVTITHCTSVYTGTKNNKIQITTVEGNTKFKNTYKAITIFIQWYNQNKKIKNNKNYD